MYVDKIASHKQLEFEDIKQFFADQVKVLGLQEYATNIEQNTVMFGSASCNLNGKKVVLDEENLKKGIISIKKEYQIGLLGKFRYNFNDLYNISIIETIFHELWHFKQYEELDKDLNHNYCILIKSANEFMRRSGSTYRFFHERYYQEYNAIINSIILTLQFLKPFKLNEYSLYIMNKLYATFLLRGYGYDKERNLRPEYESPVDFLGFLSEYLRLGENDKNEELDNLLKNYKILDNDVDNLFLGHPVSDEIIEKLQKIQDGQIYATNIITEIANSSINKNYKLSRTV